MAKTEDDYEYYSDAPCNICGLVDCVCYLEDNDDYGDSNYEPDYDLLDDDGEEFEE